MALWRLFHKKEDVHCSICGERLCGAREGDCAYFGDGAGNYSAKCESCKYVNFWDISGNKQHVEKFMSENSEKISKDRLFNLKQLAKNSSVYQEILNKEQSANVKKNAFAI